MAVTVVGAGGIVIVVVAEVAFPTLAPVQFRNTSPSGGVLAVIVTIVPAVKVPPPFPLLMVKLNVEFADV